MKEKFKFNIEKPISKEAIDELNIININGLKTLIISLSLISIASIISCIFLNLDKKNSYDIITYLGVFLVSMLLSFIISEFYRFFKIGKNISPIYLNLEGIPKLACKNVSKWIDEYEEINLYMKKLNEDCRQLTCYEYYDMREFVALKEKEITDEEYEKYCKKIYQQDYSI